MKDDFQALLPVGALTGLGACGVGEALDPRLHFGTQAELPAGVDVPQDFARGADGFATDIGAAFERYYACIADVEEALGDPGLDTIPEADRELYALLCSEAAGNGWSPGNRGDEARLLNEMAIEATSCVRARGWDYPDPRPERHGRYLEIADPLAPDVAPGDPAEAAALSAVVAECLEAHAIDWSDWVIDNPRN